MITIRINLLPHRQEKRAQQQRLLILMAIGVACLGALAVMTGHLLIGEAKSAQTRRNDLLRQESAKLDEQIKEIESLKSKTQDLLARKEVVESLQTNRTEAAHLFDELARGVPEGLYLKAVRQTADQLSIQGYAQSSARVSSFMRSLDDSPRFESPNLIEVRSAIQGKLRLSEFSLTVKQSKTAAANGEDKEGGR